MSGACLSGALSSGALSVWGAVVWGCVSGARVSGALCVWALSVWGAVCLGRFCLVRLCLGSVCLGRCLSGASSVALCFWGAVCLGRCLSGALSVWALSVWGVCVVLVSPLFPWPSLAFPSFPRRALFVRPTRRLSLPTLPESHDSPTKKKPRRMKGMGTSVVQRTCVDLKSLHISWLSVEVHWTWRFQSPGNECLATPPSYLAPQLKGYHSDDDDNFWTDAADMLESSPLEEVVSHVKSGTAAHHASCSPVAVVLTDCSNLPLVVFIPASALQSGGHCTERNKALEKLARKRCKLKVA
eukprot:Em0002g11a